MKLSGMYVGLGAGDSSEEVRLIKAFMRKKFSYAKYLADTALYDDQMTAVAADMQSRYETAGKLPHDKYLSGVINFSTKVVMGYIKAPPPQDTRPVLFTVCGTGVPWWVGPDADTARAVEDRWLWQPVGYPANPFPMGKSVAFGRAELAVQMARHRDRIQQHGMALAGYSQGAIVTCEAWMDDILPMSGPLHWALPHVRKAVTWGNPMRQHGKVWPDPAGEPAPGHGIADRLMVDTPEWWHDYAHRGDLYTDCFGESGESKTAIYKIVMGAKVLSGPDSLLRQVIELLGVSDGSSLVEITAMFKAVMDAGLFFARKTGPHIDYNITPAVQFLHEA